MTAYCSTARCARCCRRRRTRPLQATSARLTRKPAPTSTWFAAKSKRSKSGISIMKNYQKGFTLVEIAIVLVIIGLLLGGILKGQEMIVQAKIKNAMADFSGISAAYHGYQDRYRAIPGDDSGAAARWAANATTGATVATSGNGNGIVTGT